MQYWQVTSSKLCFLILMFNLTILHGIHPAFMKSKNRNDDAVVVGGEVAIVQNHPENELFTRLSMIRVISLHWGDVDDENHEKTEEETPGETDQVDIHWSWTNCEPEIMLIMLRRSMTIMLAW